MFRTIKLLPTLTIVALIGLASATVVKASPTIFLTRNGTGGLCTAAPSNCVNNIDFEGASNLTDTTQPLPNSITLLGTTFKYGTGRTNGGVEIIPGVGVGAGTQVLTAAGDVIGPLFMLNNIEITLPTGINAVGFDFKNSNTCAGSVPCGATYEIFVNGTSLGAYTNPDYSTFGFFGVSDPMGISSIWIRQTTSAGGEPVIDNFTFGPTQQAEPTPEPASMLLLGTGLMGAAVVVRKRRTARIENLAGRANYQI